MHDQIATDKTIPLPISPTGWLDYGYAVLCNGNLALARSDRDIRALWSEKLQGREIHASDFSNWRIRLSVFDGSTESDTIEVPAGNWPKVDRLADGRWLVASTRAALNENNGRLYAADGTPAGAFALGDGIEHTCCATDGTLWVGYFDEGVFSGDGISSSGIAHFGADGGLLWRFNSEGLAGPAIDDCYALALDGSTLWCCYYSDFPIVRVNDGVIAHWRNTVAGARALAVHGDYVLLAGGYGDEANRVALLRLDGNQAKQVRKWRLPATGPDATQLLRGQGATLHIVGQGYWRQISLATVLANEGLTLR